MKYMVKTKWRDRRMRHLKFETKTLALACAWDAFDDEDVIEVSITAYND